MASFNIDNTMDHQMTIFSPYDNDPLKFRFFFQPGNPASEEFKKWFEDHGVRYTVFEQNYIGGVQEACVWFNDRPDMAVLFKLRFG